MFTKAYDNWVKFFTSHKYADPKNEAKALQEEMEAEVKELKDKEKEIQKEMERKLDIEKKAKLGAEALLDVVAICDERITFNEDLIAIICACPDIKAINKIIRLFKAEPHANKPAVIQSFVPLVEHEVQLYKNIKNICCENAFEPMLIDHIYHSALMLRNGEREHLVKDQLTDPLQEYFHYNRIVDILKPFLSPEAEPWRTYFFRNKTEFALELSLNYYRYFIAEAKRLQQKALPLISKVDSNKQYLSNPSKMLDFINRVIAETNQLKEKFEPLLEKLSGSGKEGYTRKDDVLLHVRGNVHLNPTQKRGQLQRLSHQSSLLEISNSEHLLAKQPEVSIDIHGAKTAFQLAKSIIIIFYDLDRIKLELEMMDKQIIETLQRNESIQARKAAIKKQKHSKHAYRCTNGNSSDPTAADTHTACMTTSNNGVGLERTLETNPKTKEKEIAAENKRLEEERKYLKTMQEEFIAWQAQKERELIEYKDAILKTRELRTSMEAERARLINADLNPENTQSSPLNIPTNTVATTAFATTAVHMTVPIHTAGVDYPLKDFEVEQLVFLNNQITNLSDLLKNLKTKNLKYSELETVVKKLSANLINPGQYPNFKLIVPDAHFTMYLPNTHKAWGKNVNGEFQLIPRQFSTLNSWKGIAGKHSIDKLADFAVERCEKAFERAGITAERLESALAFCKSKVRVCP